MKRNLVYETFCMSCAERDSGESIGESPKNGEIEGNERQEQNKDKNKVKLYKYIGETCCSVWERATEHLADLRNYSPNSHLLKHILDKHEGEEVESIKFGMKSTQEALSKDKYWNLLRYNKRDNITTL